MRLYTSTKGIARETEGGQLELLELEAQDIGTLLEEDPALATVAAAAVRETVNLADLSLLAPVPRPGTVYCVGANYASHLAEVETILGIVGDPESVPATMEKLRQTPMFFTVPASAVSPPYGSIVLPAVAPNQVDYEIEVAVIIGSGGKNISEAEAMARVAGLTLANDVSARDIQAQAMGGQEFEFGHAKGLDGFKPMGPCLVTLDEFSEPLNIEIQTQVNGEQRQLANITELIHSLPRCISYISTFHTLYPGDVILSGSPAGVGFFQGKFLQPEDVVELTATGIGSLRHTVATQAGE